MSAEPEISKVLEGLKLLLMGIKEAFDGHKKALGILAKEHDKLANVVKTQQEVIEGLLINAQNERIRREFKEDNT